MKTNNKSRRKAIAISLAVLGAAGLSQAATSANILVDPGFEIPNPLVSFGGAVNNFSTGQDKWGTENGQLLSTTTDGVSPIGTTMMGMTSSGVVSQTIQIKSLAPWSTEVANGDAFFNASALFNVSDITPAAGASIIVRFFSGGSWGAELTGQHVSGALTLDTATGTWEEIAFSGAIPTNALWIGTELQYNSDSLGSETGFVDDTGLTITTVPEPSSTLLLGLGGMGLILRRRRVS